MLSDKNTIDSNALNENTIKTIVFSISDSRKRDKGEKKGEKEKKEKKKRVITETKNWNDHVLMTQDLRTISCIQTDVSDNHFTTIYTQTEWLHKLVEHMDSLPDNIPKQIRFLREQIQQKMNGYRYQDLKKQKYNVELFVTLPFVLDLLLRSKLSCFYCKNPVLLWYEYSREPMQWSLERINNDFGHNQDNVEIACLSCNLKRRCMYHERYVYTKQIKIVKTG
jgi:hypothetical protein